jgi:signal transduction histidine kinase
MNRLWVRLSIGISGFLILVFVIQFISIRLDQAGIPQEPAGESTNATASSSTKDEIANRLIKFMAFSLIEGIAGGILISRLVSAPINDLAKTAQKIGKGDLSARAPIRGSSETIQLATTFNTMMDDLQQQEIHRKNLMADVSHELRIPLSILSGNLRAVMDHVYTLDEIEVANLYGQTRHLIRLVNDLRELALAESSKLPLEKSLCKMDLIVGETIQALDPLIQEKHIKFNVLLDSVPELEFDPGRIKQVWFNLITNALAHTPPDGEITLSASLEPDFVRFSLQDTGDGLEADKLKEVFNRFYRADESRSRETGGTGLGLAIVKAFVELHGGQVFAQSDGKNKGCTFGFTLPQTSNK